MRGAQDYREVLRRIHATRQPDVYVEIGVRHGASLALARARVIVGIDPSPELRVPLPPQARIAATTSDEFFARAAGMLDAPIDLAFIDGMHLFEFALRDFVNVEQRSSPAGVVVFDDILPNHPAQARRERATGVWTGDVWKIVPCLRWFRPDLELHALDAAPTGLLVVTGLDPANDTLRRRYAEIQACFAGAEYAQPGAETLARAGVLAPDDARVFARLAQLRADVRT